MCQTPAVFKARPYSGCWGQNKSAPDTTSALQGRIVWQEAGDDLQGQPKWAQVLQPLPHTALWPHWGPAPDTSRQRPSPQPWSPTARVQVLTRPDTSSVTRDNPLAFSVPWLPSFKSRNKNWANLIELWSFSEFTHIKCLEPHQVQSSMQLILATWVRIATLRCYILHSYLELLISSIVYLNRSILVALEWHITLIKGLSYVEKNECFSNLTPKDNHSSQFGKMPSMYQFAYLRRVNIFAT